MSSRGSSAGRCVCVAGAGLRVSRVAVRPASRFRAVPRPGRELSAFPRSPFRGPVRESGRRREKETEREEERQRKGQRKGRITRKGKRGS